MLNLKANIYGDSVMKGTVVENDLNKHAVMDQTLEKIYNSHNIEVTNKSKFGITIKMGRKILERDLKNNPDINYALIEFGGNDCNYRWDNISKNPYSTHDPLTPLEEFKENYKAMIDMIKGMGIKPMGMSLPPLDAQKYYKFLVNRGNDAKNLMKWLGDVSMLYRQHETYSNAVTQIAKTAGILFVDVREYFLQNHKFKDLMCIDGIHPNQNGHRLIHKAFDEYLTANLPAI